MTFYNYAVSLGSKKVLFKMLGERYAMSVHALNSMLMDLANNS